MKVSPSLSTCHILFPASCRPCVLHTKVAERRLWRSLCQLSTVPIISCQACHRVLSVSLSIAQWTPAVRAVSCECAYALQHNTISEYAGSPQADSRLTSHVATQARVRGRLDEVPSSSAVVG